MSKWEKYEQQSDKQSRHTHPPSLPPSLFSLPFAYLQHARVIFGLDVLTMGGARQADRAGGGAPAPLGDVPATVLLVLLLLALARHAQHVIIEGHIEVWREGGREGGREGE